MKLLTQTSLLIFTPLSSRSLSLSFLSLSFFLFSFFFLSLTLPLFLLSSSISLSPSLYFFLSQIALPLFLSIFFFLPISFYHLKVLVFWEYFSIENSCNNSANIKWFTLSWAICRNLTTFHSWRTRYHEPTSHGICWIKPHPGMLSP